MADETDRAPDAAPTSALAGFCERLHCFFAGTDGPALSLCLPAFSYDDL